MQINNKQLYWKIARPLFMVDILLISISVFLGVAKLMSLLTVWPEILNIGFDWSLGEIFNYLKWFAAIVLLLVSYLKERIFLLLALTFFFIIVLADDALQLHERSALAIISILNLQFNNIDHAIILSERIFWAILGLAGLLPVWIGWVNASIKLKARVTPIAWFFAGVMITAIGVDALHSIAPAKTIIKGVLGIIEEGGEMLFITALVSYVAVEFGALNHNPHIPKP